MIIVGERLAAIPGALSAAAELAKRSKAALVWIPRRAGERGALEAGALPGLLPGGRDASSPAAREAVAAVWGAAVPQGAGRDAKAIIAAAAAKELSGLVIGGVEASDLDSDLLKAIATVQFTVSLEVRRTAVSEAADVVLPVAPPSEKAGTFVNWEGRLRGFDTAIKTDAMSDHRVLHLLARELGVDLGTATAAAAAAELASLGAAPADQRPAAPAVKAEQAPAVKPDSLVLSTWHQLVDDGSLQAGEPHLAGTARVAVARVSPKTAKERGLSGIVTVTGNRRASIDLPLVVTEGMADGVVWLPTKSAGSWVAQDLGVGEGALVTVKGASA